MLALSVSISTSSSPTATLAPSSRSHWTTVPSSMESDSLGIVTSAMSAPVLPCSHVGLGERSGQGPRDQGLNVAVDLGDDLVEPFLGDTEALRQRGPGKLQWIALPPFGQLLGLAVVARVAARV